MLKTSQYHSHNSLRTITMAFLKPTNRRFLIVLTILIGPLFFYYLMSSSHSHSSSSHTRGSSLPLPPPLPALDDEELRWPPLLETAICRPRIYIYQIPADIQVPKEQQRTICYASNYKSELMLYEQMMDPLSQVRQLYVTENPEEAELFYIPFFGSCWLSKCWAENNWDWTQRCGVDERYVAPLMHYIHSLPYWNRTGGADHFMVHPMDGTFIYYEKSYHLFKPAIFLTTVGDKRTKYGSYHRRHRDIVIPSATGLLHRTKINPLEYLDPDTGNPLPTPDNPLSRRDIFALFRGCCPNTQPNDYYSAGVRSLLYSHFAFYPGYDIAESSPEHEYARLLSRTRYGITPQGWTLDTTRLWEYLAFGVVPVIIADGIIEPFEDDVDWNGFSVRIRREDAHRMDEMLHAISDEVYERMRRRVWMEGRRVGLEKDAWHYIVRELCRMREIDRIERIQV